MVVRFFTFYLSLIKSHFHLGSVAECLLLGEAHVDKPALMAVSLLYRK